MTPYDIGQLILCCATAGMLGLTVYVLRRHQHDDKPVIRGEVAVLRLMSKTGPVFAWELREWGVEDPERILEALVWGQYVQSEPYPGGELYALTPAGQRRARAGQ